MSTGVSRRALLGGVTALAGSVALKLPSPCASAQPPLAQALREAQVGDKLFVEAGQVVWVDRRGRVHTELPAAASEISHGAYGVWDGARAVTQGTVTVNVHPYSP